MFAIPLRPAAFAPHIHHAPPGHRSWRRLISRFGAQGRNGARVLASVALALTVLPAPSAPVVQAAAPCDPPIPNPIVCENTKVGNPASEWDIGVGAGDATIQGFATDISANKGQAVHFKIKSTAASYRIDIYRLGYYGGLGARKVATINPSASLPQNQPACLTDASTGLVDCGNWAESASWTIPADTVSGIYIARPTRLDTSGASHIPFIVRDDASTSPVLFQTSDTTWQAYNEYGGNSLYTGSPVGRAYKVSYNRPFNTRGQGQQGFGTPNWVFYAEYPMVRFLEQNGYDVSYTTGLDSDRRGSLIKNHKLFLSVGHDEYWSGAQRTNVEAARDAGTNLAFFSGNEMFWKTRWENSIDGSGTAYRTLVTYKETKSQTPIDPQDPSTWTGTWRDPRFSPPADGGRPENAVMGTIFMVNRGSAAIEVPAEDGKMRFWRGTTVASLPAGQKATLGTQTLGYEWDMDLDNGFRPAGLVRLSTTTVNVPELMQDYGNVYVAGTATHNMTLYKAPSGARVFGAGTVQWTWGLDTNHDAGPDTGPTSPDVRMQQATVNLFADMSVQPASLQAGLTQATGTTDVTAPSSAISFPANGGTLASGTPITITGSATDTGGAVGAVEVSTDGGLTWHPATSGRSSWTYSWTPVGSGSQVSIKSRAVDDSGNIQGSPSSITVTVGTTANDSLLFNGTTAYANVDHSSDINVPGDWTIEAWIKDGNGTFNHAASFIAMKGDSNLDPEASYAIGVEWGNLFAGERNNWANQWATASLGALNAATWHHVAATMKSSTGQLTLYIDGGQAAQSILPAQSSAGSAQPLNIGRNGTSGAFWKGNIDDVRLWNVVRTPTEIAANYQQSLSTIPAGLMGHWKFNEGSGTVASDSAGVAQNATLMGNASWSTDVPSGPPPADTTPPVISAVAPSAVTAASATVTWTTDEASDSQVEYGISVAYGTSTTLNSSMVTSHNQQITGLTAATLYHYRVKSKDAAGNLATSPDFTFTTSATDTMPPTISAVASSGVTNIATTITWTTNEGADSQVDYGTTTSYGSSTTLEPSLVTSHSQALNGLNASTTYHYRVKSRDAAGNPATSGDSTFVTTAAPPPGGLSLNGTSAYAEAPDAPELNITGDWTVETWFKDESGSFNHGTTYLVMKGDTNFDPEASYVVGIEWNSLFAGERTGWANQVVTASLASLDSAAWHHLAATMKSSTRQVTVYIDGVQAAQGTLGSQSTTGNARAVSIGRNGTSGGNFKGKMDDVRVWNVVRTASEVSSAFHSELSGSPTGLVGYWKFNEGSGTSAADSAGTAQNATLAGSAAFSTDVPNGPPPPDTTPPVISAVQATSITGTGTTITWTTNEASDTLVEYGLTTTYGSSTTLVATPATAHSQAIAGLTQSTLYHYRVKSKDAASNLATSPDATFTTTTADTTPPVISAVASSGISNTSATIAWTTNEAADTQVEYGTTTAYGQSSTLVATLVTSHSQALTGLTANTLYHYRVKSKDASGNLATSPDASVTTSNAAARFSLGLNGTTAYAEAPQATELNATGDWTVETWFKEDSGTYNHGTSYLVMKGDTNFDPEAPFMIGIEWGSIFAGERTAWTNRVISASLGTISVGAWHHVAATMATSTRQLTIYIDGVQVAQGILPAQSTAGNARAVSLGRNGTTGQNFTGKLDDVRIWNVVRTATLIQASYHTELTSSPAGLVGNWKFNEGTGTSAADTAGTAQNATFNGSATWSSDLHP